MYWTVLWILEYPPSRCELVSVLRLINARRAITLGIYVNLHYSHLKHAKHGCRPPVFKCLRCPSGYIPFPYITASELLARSFPVRRTEGGPAGESAMHWKSIVQLLKRKYRYVSRRSSCNFVWRREEMCSILQIRDFPQVGRRNTSKRVVGVCRSKLLEQRFSRPTNVIIGVCTDILRKWRRVYGAPHPLQIQSMRCGTTSSKPIVHGRFLVGPV